MTINVHVYLHGCDTDDKLQKILDVVDSIAKGQKAMATKVDVNAAIDKIVAKVQTAADAASQEIADVKAKIQSLIDAGTGTISAEDAQGFVDRLGTVETALDGMTANLQAEDADAKGSGTPPPPVVPPVE